MESPRWVLARVRELKPEPGNPRQLSALESLLERLVATTRSPAARQSLAAEDTVASIASCASQLMCLPQGTNFQDSVAIGHEVLLDSQVHRPLLLCLQILRNLCAGVQVHQDAFLRSEALDAVTSILDASLPSHPKRALSSHQLAPGDRTGFLALPAPLQAFAQQRVRTCLQVLGNFARGGENHRAAVWGSCFPLSFLRAAEQPEQSIQEPLCMVLATCCETRTSRCSDLCSAHTGGAALLALLLRAFVAPQSSGSAPQQSTEPELITGPALRPAPLPSTDERRGPAMGYPPGFTRAEVVTDGLTADTGTAVPCNGPSNVPVSGACLYQCPAAPALGGGAFMERLLDVLCLHGPHLDNAFRGLGLTGVNAFRGLGLTDASIGHCVGLQGSGGAQCGVVAVATSKADATSKAPGYISATRPSLVRAIGNGASAPDSCASCPNLEGSRGPAVAVAARGGMTACCLAGGDVTAKCPAGGGLTGSCPAGGDVTTSCRVAGCVREQAWLMSCLYHLADGEGFQEGVPERPSGAEVGLRLRDLDDGCAAALVGIVRESGLTAGRVREGTVVEGVKGDHFGLEGNGAVRGGFSGGSAAVGVVSSGFGEGSRGDGVSSEGDGSQHDGAAWGRDDSLGGNWTQFPEGDDVGGGGRSQEDGAGSGKGDGLARNERQVPERDGVALGKGAGGNKKKGHLAAVEESRVVGNDGPAGSQRPACCDLPTRNPDVDVLGWSLRLLGCVCAVDQYPIVSTFAVDSIIRDPVELCREAGLVHLLLDLLRSLGPAFSVRGEMARSGAIQTSREQMDGAGAKQAPGEKVEGGGAKARTGKGTHVGGCAGSLPSDASVTHNDTNGVTHRDTAGVTHRDTTGERGVSSSVERSLGVDPGRKLAEKGSMAAVGKETMASDNGIVEVDACDDSSEPQDTNRTSQRDRTGSSAVPYHAQAGNLRSALEFPNARPSFPAENVYKGYRRDIVAVLANAAHRRRKVQDEVREAGGLLVVLQQCVVAEDNPFLREWGLWAVRNLCEGNEANQMELRELEMRGPADAVALEAMGYRVVLDEETHKLRLDNTRC